MVKTGIIQIFQDKLIIVWHFILEIDKLVLRNFEIQVFSSQFVSFYLRIQYSRSKIVGRIYRE